MKIDAPTNLTKFTKAEDLAVWVSRALESISNVVNGRLDLVSNVQTNIITVVFSSANTVTSAAHNLKRVPNGYIPVSLSVNMVVFNDPTRPHDASNFYFQSSAVGTAKFWVF